MKVISHRNINLHSASTQGGLIHVPAKRVVIVPDDVDEHPQIGYLTKDGTLQVLEGPGRKTKATLRPAGNASKREPTTLLDDDDLGPAQNPTPLSTIPHAQDTHEQVLGVRDEDEDEDEDEEEERKPAPPPPPPSAPKAEEKPAGEQK
jgi:hypothetical protein